MIREVRRYQQEEKDIAAEDKEEEEEDAVAEEAGGGLGDDDEEEEEDPYQIAEESVSVIILPTTPSIVDYEDDTATGDRLERIHYGRRAGGVKHSVSNVTDPGFFTDPPVGRPFRTLPYELDVEQYLTKRLFDLLISSPVGRRIAKRDGNCKRKGDDLLAPTLSAIQPSISNVVDIRVPLHLKMIMHILFYHSIFIFI